MYDILIKDFKRRKIEQKKLLNMNHYFDNVAIALVRVIHRGSFLHHLISGLD